MARSRPPSAENHAASVQEPQAAASITTTSLSCPQPQTSGASGRSLSSVSHIWARLEFDWGYTYYIRLDHQGSFHTYPDLGGPYQSLKEAHKAIDRHLDEVRDPKMSTLPDDVSNLDVVIRRGLYWPDGTSKRRSKSRAMQKSRDQMHQMVKALLDKYNEDYHLLGDLAYELKDVLSFESISEHKSWYYHLNFSTNSKAADDSDCSTSNIFFAEVEHLRHQGGHIELSVCCFYALDPISKGQPCNGCTTPGNYDMRHPDTSIKLAAGYSDPRCQFGGYIQVPECNDSEDEDTYLREREAELRHMYKGLDDPRVIESLFTFPPGVTIVRDEKAHAAECSHDDDAV